MNASENSSNPYVRMAITDEAASIAVVLYQSFAEYKSLYTPEAFAATTPTADQIKTRWSEGPVWVAVHNSGIVGTVSSVPQGQALYVRSMAIVPTARGRGLGKLLLQQVEGFAVEQRFQHLRLSTTPFLTRAIRLYEQFGFRRSNDGPHELFGTPSFTMVKPLRAGNPSLE